MYELAEITADPEFADLQPLPKKKRNDEGITVVRCPGCGWPHVVSARHARRGTVCRPCSHGKEPESLAVYHGFWLERFSRAEIWEMAVAIWGRST